MRIPPFKRNSPFFSGLLAAGFFLTLALPCSSQPREETIIPEPPPAPAKKSKKTDPFGDLPRILPEPIPEDSFKREEKIERREKSVPREPSHPEPVTPSPPPPAGPVHPPDHGRLGPGGSTQFAWRPVDARLILVNGTGGEAMGSAIATPPVEKDSAKEQELRANLIAVIKLTCREFLGSKDPGIEKTRKACQILSKERPSDKDLADIDKLLFEVTGMNLDQLKAEVSRTGRTEFTQQMHLTDLKERLSATGVPEQIPIEFTGIRKVHLDGRDDELDISHNAEVRNYTVGNTILLSRDEVISSLADRFCEQGLVVSIWPLRERIELVMLPDGQREGKALLWYTYKMEVIAKQETVGKRQKPDSCLKGEKLTEAETTMAQQLPGREAAKRVPEIPYIVYVDAQSSKIRELRPLVTRAGGTVEALGWSFRRDPGVDGAEQETFVVDSAHELTGHPTEVYTLRLHNVFHLIGEDVWIEAVGKPRADFAERQITWLKGYDVEHDRLNVKMVACEIGDEHRGPGNTDFERIDLMGILSRYRKGILDLDIIRRPFPGEGRTITIEFPGDHPDCDARVSGGRQLFFGRCTGYGLPECPSVAKHELSPVHDHTVVAHEFGHVLMAHIYKSNSGAIYSTFHDFADAWVHVLEGTNCVGGWWYKNMTGQMNPCGGKGDPDDGLPRISKVAYPGEILDENDHDHFPEHRKISLDDDGKLVDVPYANMQIAAAALWASREGLRSRSLAVGTSLYLVRFVNAVTGLGGFAKSGPSTNANDREVYDGLFELQQALMSQWSATKSGEINKVAAGFARTGLFLIPAVCLDGNSSSNHDKYCKNGDSGADAVIDIDDGTTTNDVVINGVKQRRVDFLKRYRDETDNGTRPSFHVWTGPRYLLEGTQAKLPDKRQRPAPCNSHYQVSVTVSGGSLGGKKTITSDVLTVETAHDKPANQQCYANWQFPEPAWKDLSQGTTLNYEVETWTVAANGDKINRRVSTRPGNGIFGTFSLPSAVINDTGTP